MSSEKSARLPGPTRKQLEEYVAQHGKILLENFPGLSRLRIAEDTQGPFIWLILEEPEIGQHREWAWPLPKKGGQLRFKRKWVRRTRRKPATKDPR